MRVVVLAVLLAGCASVGPAPLSVDPVDDVARFDVIETHASGCLTTAVFFLVDPVVAYEHLPLGFTPRDLSGFLYNTPVTSGKIPVYVATSTCETFLMNDTKHGVEHDASLELAFVGVYVEPPPITASFADAEADHHFYSVAYIAPGDDGLASHVPVHVTESVEWTWMPGRIDVDVLSQVRQETPEEVSKPLEDQPVPDRFEALISDGRVTINGSMAFQFKADAFFPQAFDTKPRLRFWQAAEHGLGFMEFQLPQKTVAAGPLSYCEVQPGSFIADVIGARGPAGDCGLVESFALVFDDHELTGSLRHLEGVHLV